MGGPYGLRFAPCSRRVAGPAWSTRREQTAWSTRSSDLEEQSERVGEHIEETRDDWESKEEDPAVPGAQPDLDERRRGERVTETHPRSPTSCPRRAPSEQVPDDGGRTGPRRGQGQPRRAGRGGHRHRQPGRRGLRRAGLADD